jgi:NADH-quinone oxidoreductase subunit A
MSQYLPIACLFVVATLFAGLSFIASRLLAPQRPTAPKLSPYECGIVPTKEPAERFPVRFYLIAMIFIIFDIEIIFIFPWATIFKDPGFGFYGLIEMITFVASAIVALIYLFSLGALNWGPAKRLETFSDPTRTSETTVVRVANAEEAA